MAQTQKIYLGSHPVEKRYLGEHPILTSLVPEYKIFFREDAYAEFLEFAVVGSANADLYTNFYDDVHADVSGSGTNFIANPTGSAAEFNKAAANKWNTTPYNGSLSMSGSASWGGINDGDLVFGSDDFVIEGYVYVPAVVGEWNNPPFWTPAIEHSSGYLRLDFGNPSPDNITDARFRFLYDVGGGQQVITTSNQTFARNSWHHIAWVRNGAEANIYLDGSRIHNSSPFSTNAFATDGSNIRMLSGASATNDGGRRYWNDFRIYIGTNKGYTGASITPPDSILI